MYIAPSSNGCSILNAAYRNIKLESFIAQYKFGSDMDFSYQQINDSDVMIIVEKALKQKRCTGLNLSSNEITFQGASILADALKSNKTLERLYLWENPLTDEGARVIAEVLSVEESILKDLRLGWTGITDQAVIYLGEMLKINKGFTNLWMRENQIGDIGMAILADVLTNYNTSLEILWLRGNTLITDSSVDCVISMLKSNRSLKQLSLELCNISDAGKEKVREISKTKPNFYLWI